ncbi:MAG: PD-(D/E)XK nuclease domain-containing protein [Ruminococcus sp.]|nr:PD-(D/E)XK nuclease domain-containing protein [Ruminococcus sp.]
MAPIYSPDVRNGSYITTLVKAVMAGDTEKFMSSLACFFADFPYEQIPNLEVHYQNVVYIILKLMGFYVRTEYRTSNGRVDMVIETDDFIYVIEFKLGDTPQAALQQIQEKSYCEPFLYSDKQIICIGVTFNPQTRALESWEAISICSR